MTDRYRTVPAYPAEKPTGAIKFGWFCFIVGVVAVFADERGIFIAMGLAVLILIAAIIGMAKGRIVSAIVLIACTAIAFVAGFLLRAVLFVAGV